MENKKPPHLLHRVMRIETTRHTPLAGSGLVAPPPKPDRHVSAHPAFPPRLSLQTLGRSAGRSPEVPRTAGATPPSGPYPQSSLACRSSPCGRLSRPPTTPAALPPPGVFTARTRQPH